MIVRARRHRETADEAAKPVMKRGAWARSSISTKLLAVAQGTATEERDKPKPKTLAQHLIEESDRKDAEEREKEARKK